MRRLFGAISVVGMTLATSALLHAAPRADGELEIEIVDADTGKPLAARVHLMNARKRPVKVNVPNTAEFGGHLYVDGTLTLPLRRGQYTFEIDAGPEYRTQSGHFEIERHADDSKRVEMKSFADLAKEGWYGGDVDFDRTARDLDLIMRGAKLQDIRTREHASMLGLGAGGWGLEARRLDSSPAPSPQPPVPRVHIARSPYAWNLPVWIARGELDAIELINHRSLRAGVVDRAADKEEDGRPRDRSLFPGKTGNARWSETVYYHVLNCGLRVPPVAGSGSGENDNPVGTNRVYVFCEGEFSPEAWWEGVSEGRVFVTNGPLLRPIVEGHPPGYVFHLDGRDTLTLEVGVNLATRVPIEYLEIIKNGAVEVDVRLEEWKQKKGRLPPLSFDDSGWFLVRAKASNQDAYYLASTGPYYVEKAGRPRVSRASVQFFLDWILAAETHIRGLTTVEDAARDSLLAEQAEARDFFEQLLAMANAD
jgi:hypothetical protein